MDRIGQALVESLCFQTVGAGAEIVDWSESGLAQPVWSVKAMRLLLSPGRVGSNQAGRLASAFGSLGSIGLSNL